jgi:hypothetical protein
MLFLPDWQAGFCFIDHIATRLESGATVSCGDSDPHRKITDSQRPDPVDTYDCYHIEFRPGFDEYSFSFPFCERDEGLVIQRLDCATVIVIPHPAFEGHAGTCTGAGKLPIQQQRLQG